MIVQMICSMCVLVGIYFLIKTFIHSDLVKKFHKIQQKRFNYYTSEKYISLDEDRQQTKARKR